MNTHIFDGKYDPLVIQNLLIDLPNDIKCLVDRVNSNIAKNILNTMINDNHSTPNYEPQSGLYADDLLKLCCKFANNQDFIEELEIQLLDMQSGMCPQGRVTRLYQLLVAFLEV